MNKMLLSGVALAAMASVALTQPASAADAADNDDGPFTLTAAQMDEITAGVAIQFVPINETTALIIFALETEAEIAAFLDILPRFAAALSAIDIPQTLTNN